MLNVPVPEIGLQRAGVVPLVGQGVPASVPEHMRREARDPDSERKASDFPARCCLAADPASEFGQSTAGRACQRPTLETLLLDKPNCATAKETVPSYSPIEGIPSSDLHSLQAYQYLGSFQIVVDTAIAVLK